jgi:hypothetical protein
MISSADAHLLITKYRSEQTRLRITFILRDTRINIRLTANALSTETGFDEVTFVAPSGDFCLTLVRGCEFEYGDAREIDDPALRERSAFTFTGCLTILFPDGEKLIILELRD